MPNQSDEEIKKEIYEKLTKTIKITGRSKTGTIDWVNYFLMIKRWYYRLRDSDFYFKDSYSIGSLKMEEDYLWIFFILCYHLKDWLTSSGTSEKEETENYINNNKALSVCADVCNSSKHYRLTKIERCRTKNLETRIINPLVEIEYKNKKKYIPITFIVSDQKSFEIYALIDDCMQAWGEFIISKNLKIPEFKEENNKTGFIKWNLS